MTGSTRTGYRPRSRMVDLEGQGDLSLLVEAQAPLLVHLRVQHGLAQALDVGLAHVDARVPAEEQADDRLLGEVAGELLAVRGVVAAIGLGLLELRITPGDRAVGVLFR